MSAPGHLRKVEATKDDWMTPWRLYARLDREFSFTLDVASDDLNHKTPRYLTSAEDALQADWLDHRCWMNPPYGGVMPQWMAKASDAARSGALVVALVPNGTETGWFHQLVVPTAHEVRLLKQRVSFIDPETNRPKAGNTVGSMVVVWHPGPLPSMPARILAWDWRG